MSQGRQNKAMNESKGASSNRTTHEKLSERSLDDSQKIQSSPDDNTSRNYDRHKDSKEVRNPNANRQRQANNARNSPEGTNDRGNNFKYQSQQLDKIPKWKINPLENCDKGRETCLKSRFPSHGNQPRNKGSSVCLSDNNADVSIEQLCTHLQQVSELSYSQCRNSIDSNFQWGRAIKIEKTNGNVDKKDNTETRASENIVGGSCAETSSIVDGVKRRREACTNKWAMYDFSDGSNEENNSDEDFEMFPKRLKTHFSSKKTATTSKSTETKTTESPPPQSTVTTLLERKSDDSAIYVEGSDDCAITDDETSTEPPKKTPRGDSVDSESTYPKRIVPPMPGRKLPAMKQKKLDMWSKPKNKNQREENNETNRSGLKRKNNSILEDEEIAQVLDQNSDDENEDINVATNDEPVEIRPMRISTRVKMQSQRLVQIKEKEKEEDEVRKMEERMKEEAARREKMERIEQRKREEQEKQRQKEEADREKSVTEERWNKFLKTTKKAVMDRTELHPDGRPKNKETLQEAHTSRFSGNMSEDECIIENSSSTQQQSDYVQCPICNKRFAIENIEAHAGSCEEFDNVPPGASRSSSPTLTPPRLSAGRRNHEKLLQCHMCDNYATDDGSQYEEHVTNCIRRKSLSQNESGVDEINLELSPVRSFTISDDTEDLFKSQFVPKTKSNKTAGKKRKR